MLYNIESLDDVGMNWKGDSKISDADKKGKKNQLHTLFSDYIRVRSGL